VSMGREDATGFEGRNYPPRIHPGRGPA
jgi:hypothetical protein